MSRFTSLFRKAGIAGIAALTLAGSMAASVNSADARWRGHHHHHRGGGWIGPAIVGGLALGALSAATAAPYYYGPRRCWTEEREVIDRWGRVFIRPTRVCN